MRILPAMLSIFLLGCTASNSEYDQARDSGSGWPAQTKPEEIENYVPWDQAVDLLLENAEIIKAVSQGHELGVNIIFKNQSYVGTIEPDIDAIFGVLQDCGTRCDHIVWITQ